MTNAEMTKSIEIINFDTLLHSALYPVSRITIGA